MLTPPPTLAHHGAYIRERNKSMKIEFKYAGIANGCAGCVYGTRNKKNFEDWCPLSKVMNVFLHGVEQAEFELNDGD